MSLSAIREQIKVILAGVAGIGVIHDYERWAADYGTLMNLFKDSEGRINACIFAQKKRQEKYVVMGAPDKNRVFGITFIMGLKDSEATGILFEDLLERAVDAFRGNDDLNGACLTCSPEWGEVADLSGLQIGLIEPRMFGGVLCHYAEAILGVVER